MHTEHTLMSRMYACVCVILRESELESFFAAEWLFGWMDVPNNPTNTYSTSTLIMGNVCEYKADTSWPAKVFIYTKMLSFKDKRNSSFSPSLSLLPQHFSSLSIITPFLSVYLFIPPLFSFLPPISSSLFRLSFPFFLFCYFMLFLLSPCVLYGLKYAHVLYSKLR